MPKEFIQNCITYSRDPNSGKDRKLSSGSTLFSKQISTRTGPNKKKNAADGPLLGSREYFKNDSLKF